MKSSRSCQTIRHRMAWPLGATLLVCLGTVSAAFADDAAGASTRLEYRFTRGESVTMAVSHRARTETTISGTTQWTDTATDSTKRWKVIEVDGEGRATIEHSVDDVTMSSRSSDRGELRFTSKGEDPAPPGYESVRQNLGVPLSRVVIDRAGRVLSRTELRPTPPSASGDLMVVPLPDGPVEVGAEWTVPQEVVVEVPGGPRRAVRTRQRYRLESIRDDVAVIAVDTTVLTPVDDPRLESRLLERIWDGSIAFDIPTGRVLRRSTGMDRRVVGFSGQESSVRYKSSLEEELVSEPDEPR
jgi:hypothetical protein